MKFEILLLNHKFTKAPFFFLLKYFDEVYDLKNELKVLQDNYLTEV